DAHGLRRSNEDKAAAVRLLLADPEWAQKSSNWIAEVCRVSHTFVDNVRSSTCNVASSTGARLGRDGKARKARSKKAPPAAGDAWEEGSGTPEAKGSRPNPGEIIFDQRRFNDGMGILMRLIDRVGNAYGCKETPQAEGLRRQLGEFQDNFMKWMAEASSRK